MAHTSTLRTRFVLPNTGTGNRGNANESSLPRFRADRDRIEMLVLARDQDRSASQKSKRLPKFKMESEREGNKNERKRCPRLTVMKTLNGQNFFSLIESKIEPLGWWAAVKALRFDRLMVIPVRRCVALPKASTRLCLICYRSTSIRSSRCLGRRRLPMEPPVWELYLTSFPYNCSTCRVWRALPASFFLGAEQTTAH